MTLNLSSLYNEELNFWLVEIKGEVDVFTAKELKKKLVDIYTEKESDIVIDFEQLNYIDSTGLGVIIGAFGRMKESNHKLSIINPKQNILKLLTITGLDKIFMC
ncbi:MAG: STAS domain-containing protein [Clostridia bacterium]|nr:STAS domain-containing protein [Clostridia bacterium]